METTKAAIGTAVPIILLLAVAAIAYISFNESDNSDKIVAKVNGIPITKEQFAKHEALLKANCEDAGKPAPIKEEVVIALAKEMLLVVEANERGIIVSEQEIDQEVERDRQKFEGASPEEQQKLREYYEKRDIDLDKYWLSSDHRTICKDRLAIRKLFADRLSQAQTEEERGKVLREAKEELKEDLYRQATIRYCQ
ncbi:MAG: SurA N-terminal domain-containing protein [Actinobacteria bacterium]|nr:SurA N-terminal domain-containing protein [Actinomycetota bacterium]